MNKKFEIPKVVKDNYPKLVNLILEAKSMNDEEKLEKIDMEYKKNLQKLQDSRQDFKMDAIKKKAETRKKIEADYEKNEELLEAEILKEIESMEE